MLRDRAGVIVAVGLTFTVAAACGANRDPVSVATSGSPAIAAEQTASTGDPAASCPPAGGAAVAATSAATTTTPAEQSPLQSLRDPLLSELWQAIDEQVDNISYEDLVALGAVQGVAPTDRASKGGQLPPDVAVYFSGPDEVTIAGPEDEVARIMRERASELSRFTVKTTPPLGGGAALVNSPGPTCPPG